VYLKIAWYERPGLHLQILIGAVAVLAVAVVALPVAAFAGRRRPAGPRLARHARLAAWLNAVLAVGVVAGIVSLLSDQNAAFEMMTLGSPVLYGLMVGATVAVAGSVAVAVAAVAAWGRGWWRPAGRIAYTLLAVSGLAFAGVAFAYNLTGPPFN
ncbi:MAG TPA: serine hydrolase, partial [Phytomonospora sp.]